MNPVSWIDIDFKALRHNLRVIYQRVRRKSNILFVVKSEAYGHGMIPICRAVSDMKEIVYFGVSNLHELVRLRDAGIKKPTLILGSLPPDEMKSAILNHATLTLSNKNEADTLNKEARSLKKRVKVHVEIDTGMGRLGVDCQRALNLLFYIRRLPYLHLEGVYTHFPSADEVKFNFSARQIKMFNYAVTLFQEMYPRDLKFFHTANSLAMVRFPQSHFNLVRPGIMAYGLKPTTRQHLQVKPILTWKSRIALIKRIPAGVSISYGRTHKLKKSTRIATIPVGYSSGYPFRLSNQSHVLIKGKKYPVVGRVTMDHIMVDIGNKSRIREWDEAVLIGKSGKKRITVEEIAGKLETIPYEITCGISPRIQRVYKG